MKNKLKFSNDRNFGITASIIFFIIYIYSLDNFDLVINNYIIGSLILFLVSITKPNLLNLLNFFVFKIGLLIMKTISSLNIFIIYHIIFGSIGIFMRIFNYDPLFLKKNKIDKASSFWKKRNNKYNDIKSMKNQF
tara:strand:+ start:202 stop:606 length:405 start_codon:yes stop_codon:yes gene_type:complete